jgi:hypothetical protein
VHTGDVQPSGAATKGQQQRSAHSFRQLYGHEHILKTIAAAHGSQLAELCSVSPFTIKTTLLFALRSLLAGVQTWLKLWNPSAVEMSSRRCEYYSWKGFPSVLMPSSPLSWLDLACSPQTCLGFGDQDHICQHW